MSQGVVSCTSEECNFEEPNNFLADVDIHVAFDGSVNLVWLDDPE